MLRHILLIVLLSFAALAAGVAMVPGEREQWTMLVRDGRNQEALRALEARYRAGKRDPDAVLHLHKLYMSFADVEQATRIMENFASDRPNDPTALTMLARHYGDIQNKRGEIRALERLFELAPSLQTARDLLSHYRLEGKFDREEQLLRTMLANDMIPANDAERLGLMLAAGGDLYGAREALTRFDEIANPERTIGRFALFDVLVQTGDKTAALTKAASWIIYWRKTGLHRPAGPDTPAIRLIRMMMAVDDLAARRLICEVQRSEKPVVNEELENPCALIPAPGEAAVAGTGVSSIDPGEGPGRRRRR